MSQQVNVHTHAINARKRTNGSGPLRPVGDDPPETPLPTGRSWRDFFKWETLTVAGKVIEKGWAIPQNLGIALIVLVLGGVGGMYWRMDSKLDAAVTADQDSRAKAEAATKENRELLIRLDQKLIDKDTHDREKLQELRQQFESVQAWQQVTNKDIAKLQIKR